VGISTIVGVTSGKVGSDAGAQAARMWITINDNIIFFISLHNFFISS